LFIVTSFVVFNNVSKSKEFRLQIFNIVSEKGRKLLSMHISTPPFLWENRTRKNNLEREKKQESCKGKVIRFDVRRRTLTKIAAPIKIVKDEGKKESKVTAMDKERKELNMEKEEIDNK
jgi:hypothetical protein